MYMKYVMISAGHVENRWDETLAESRRQKIGGNGGEEDRNCDGGCIKSDLERVGDEWKKW